MEENPDETCKNAIATTSIPSNASSSHFISMAMRNHPKLTIKIPKFMDKIMRGRTSRRTERGHQFPKNVVSVFFSRVFGRKRLVGEKAEDHGDSESLVGRSDSHEGKVKHFTAEGNDLVRRNERIVGSLSQLMKLELDDALKPHDAKEGKHKNGTVALESIVDGNKSCNGEAEGEKTDNVVNGWEVWRMKVRSSRLVRVVSSIMSITSWLKKKVSKEVEDEGEEEEGGEEEEACLCKKRILMGGRCKPLYSSGTLEYDSDGILIPDHLLWD